MNDEQLIASKIRQALDESVEALPYRVTHRLEQARERALTQAASVRRSKTPGALLRAGAAAVLSGPGSRGEPSRWWARAGLAALPPLMIAACLYGISAWNEATDAEEIAALDAEVLSDEVVPISTLSDRGFGVYLHNTSYQK